MNWIYPELVEGKILTTNVSAKSRSTTKVFTERGLYMLATILKGDAARDMTFKTKKIQPEGLNIPSERNTKSSVTTDEISIPIWQTRLPK